jgi:hypothetical protein
MFCLFEARALEFRVVYSTLPQLPQFESLRLKGQRLETNSNYFEYSTIRMFTGEARITSVNKIGEANCIPVSMTMARPGIIDYKKPRQ